MKKNDEKAGSNVTAEKDIEEIIKSVKDKVLKGEECTQQEIEALKAAGIGIDGYGQVYKVNFELRNEFPNSFFYDDIYDDSIIGVNLITQSVTYDLALLGACHTVHIEGISEGLGDCLECGGIVTDRINNLTPEEINGKVSPNVIMLKNHIEHWSYVKDYIR